MCQICPTVTAFDTTEYGRQMEVNRSFADRIHVDLMDGEFAPSISPEMSELYLADDKICDIHLMYERPGEYIDQLIALKPHMVIIHAEATLDHDEFVQSLHGAGIKVGLAFLASTAVADYAEIIPLYDHALVFSGNLGYQGGSSVDFGLLGKVNQLKDIKPSLEIGWDGGVSDVNAQQLAEGGIEVLNTGGFIQKAEDPSANYAMLVNLVKDTGVK